MLATFVWVLLFSPAAVVEATVDRAVFPKDAKEWDRIGIVKLKDGENTRLVLLYYHDTDSVAEKEMKKKGSAMLMYPNIFRVHAVYVDASGKWVHKEVFGCARVRFTKIAKTMSDRIVLEYRPNFMVEVEHGDVEKAEKRAKEINKPFTKQLSFVDGVLTLK